MILRIKRVYLVAVVLGLIGIVHTEEPAKESTNLNKKSKLINAQVCMYPLIIEPTKLYSYFGSFLNCNPLDTKLFQRHREEQKRLLSHIRGIEDYAKRYKLLSVGLMQILDVTQFNSILQF